MRWRDLPDVVALLVVLAALGAIAYFAFRIACRLTTGDGVAVACLGGALPW